MLKPILNFKRKEEAKHFDSAQPQASVPVKGKEQVLQKMQTAGASKHTASNLQQEQALSSAQKQCFFAGLLSAKGGNGASTVALNLGLALARQQRLACTIIDANLQDPDLVIQLGCQPEHSLIEFLARSSQSDQTTFAACSLNINDEGAPCRVMSGTANGESAGQSNLSQIASALSALSRENEIVLLDLPGTLDRHLVTLLDKLDTIILVFEGTVSSIASVKRWLKAFDELGYPQSRIMLVHNRAGARTGETGKDLEHLIGSNEIFRLPNSYAFLLDCQTKGRPAIINNPREKYSKAIIEVSQVLSKLAGGIGSND